MVRISHTARAATLGALLALPLTLAACRNVSSPRQLYSASIKDNNRYDGGGGLVPRASARNEARFERVIARYNAGKTTEADDIFWSSALLAQSWNVEHLVLAQALAQRAVQLGEERGNVIIAETTDKLLFSEGKPQRYGTQLVYLAVLGEWRLYAIDPETTDAQRAAVGVPPLAELERRVRTQNESALSQRLRRDPEPEDKPDFLKRPVNEGAQD